MIQRAGKKIGGSRLRLRNRQHGGMSLAKTLVIGLGSLLILAGCGKPTPAGYWEGKGTAKEVAMKDQFKTLNRSVDVEFWFTVNWSPRDSTGVVAGEAEAAYEAELKVEHLPKVTVPVPGGSVKFEPEVGGKLTDPDPRRKFPIVGVLSLKEEGGTLILQKVVTSLSNDAMHNNKWAADTNGQDGSEQPLQFTIRADPGVSGGLEVEYGKSEGKPGGKSEGKSEGEGKAKAKGEWEAKADLGVDVITIPMTPFSPFNDSPAKVEKRPGGPYVADFEEKGKNYSIVWSAKQMGGEKREAPKLTPEMEQQIQQLKKMLQSKH
jgi:hypothetical protein